jgi:hypothetical protein
LVGTSRFGDEYYASLRNRDNTQVSVEWIPGTIVEIKGYGGYAVAQITSRKVSIRLPDSEPCITNQDQGVSCNGQFAVLSLSNMKPTPSRITPTQSIESSADGQTDLENEDIPNQNQGEINETIGNTNVLLRNPFSGELQTARNLTPEELADREQRRQQRVEAFRNFEIVRIADDEIPEGMERERTPFGDRLVPIEE